MEPNASPIRAFFISFCCPKASNFPLFLSIVVVRDKLHKSRRPNPNPNPKTDRQAYRPFPQGSLSVFSLSVCLAAATLSTFGPKMCRKKSDLRLTLKTSYLSPLSTFLLLGCKNNLLFCLSLFFYYFLVFIFSSVGFFPRFVAKICDDISQICGGCRQIGRFFCHGPPTSLSYKDRDNFAPLKFEHSPG